MDEDKLTKIMDSITDKVGKDAAATIADDLGQLITENSNTLKELENRASKIKDLESKNEKLVAANGNLLQQIPMAEGSAVGRGNAKQAEEAPKTISLKDAFDSKGNFIH